MSFDIQKLYGLLPALYRIRDTKLGVSLLTPAQKQQILQLEDELKKLADQQGWQADEKRRLIDEQQRGPLKALLSVIADQVAVLEEDLQQLYDNQFIETCAAWLVPYIGDLVGARGIVALPDARFSQRALVANTISYRRRKGTAAIIEQLARDVTGWNANVVEYFQHLATTQYLNHPRPANYSMASLRKWEWLENLDTPFDQMAHTADVRSIESKRGKYNIPNIGIYLWRLESYPLVKSPAYQIDALRYTFDALGKNTRLYNNPETETEITHLAGPLNVPLPLSRRVLDRDLEIYYRKDAKNKDKSLLIYKDGVEVLPAENSPPESPLSEKLSDVISVCDLSDLNAAGDWANMPDLKIAIDPVLGRLAFPPSQAPGEVKVTYHYGFSTAMGGGGYSRNETFTVGLQPVIRVPSDEATLQGALDAVAASGGVVEIQDNEYYFADPVISIAPGKKIELRAAEGKRPVLVLQRELVITEGARVYTGEEQPTAQKAEVIINGLVICGGRVRVDAFSNQEPDKLQHIRLRHCTLLPGLSPAVQHIEAQTAILARLVIELPDAMVSIDKCITGGIRATDGASVQISNSIVDASDEMETAFSGLREQEAGAALQVENTTVIGLVRTMLLKMASNTIFLSRVMTSRLQQGCIRFSYYHPDSVLPRPYHCQPADTSEAARLRPVFTSMRYGDAGYCQLSEHCAIEITQGADDQAEMGVFHNLFQSQREAGLRKRLDEYLRFGLEAGIYFGS